MTHQKSRIIGYVRLSTDKQGIGPEVQIDALREEAERMGWELTIVREDAVSAATVAKRPLMLRALADLKAKRYNGLAESKLDRLGRNMEDGTRLLADSQRQAWRITIFRLETRRGGKNCSKSFPNPHPKLAAEIVHEVPCSPVRARFWLSLP